MKKIALFAFAAFSLVSVNLFSQVLDEPTDERRDSFYDKVSNKKRIPFEFNYVREADVAWEWRVWRVIDFREKLNQVFYYPIQPTQGRVNFFDAVENAVKEGKIKIYKDDEFKFEETDWEGVKARLVPSTTIQKDVTDIDGTVMTIDTVIKGSFTNEDVKTLRIKENWFVDKARSVMDVRIAGFAPIYYQIKEEGSAPITIPLFWIRYDDPEVRTLLANTEVYNERNDAERRSYDDIFLKRYFNSYIIRESNRYGDRTISQYTIGDEALAESENIKDKIFSLEEDMWEY